jgi:diaminohydroxyphosphoribosylaminopyrimidine deaminase / 5-amino-6-(5-phosphoribosylamino)uracil reductase
MSDTQYMQQCLTLARQGRYTTHPNPMVGCVIVKDDSVIGKGFHTHAGEAHAEIIALQEAGARARGATLYVNLEPCCHQGRTPPCVDAIVKAGIKKVVVAMEDPNPLVLGGGIRKLKDAGIEILVGVLAPEAEHLNRAFCHYITAKTPFIIAKWAMSLDGEMKTPNPNERQLSSAVSQENTHELRQCTQAILIGSNTARADNPSLTVRFPDVPDAIYRQPQRIIVNTHADLDPHSRLFNGDLPGKTWLVCADEFFKTAQQNFNAKTTEIIGIPNSASRINLTELLKILGEREIMSVLVEGGKTVLKEFFKIKQVHEIICFVTPWYVDGLPHKLQLQPLHAEISGPDIKITSQLL